MVMAWVFFSGDVTLDSADTGADSSNGIWIKAGGSKVVTASVAVPDLAAYRGLLRGIERPDAMVMICVAGSRR